MGWDCEDVGFQICLRLDAHGGEKEREHERLALLLRNRCREALRPVLTDAVFEEILLFDIDYMLGTDDV